MKDKVESNELDVSSDAFEVMVNAILEDYKAVGNNGSCCVESR